MPSFIRLILGAILSLLVGAAAVDYAPDVREAIFGAGYTPATAYEARTTAFISASAATIGVNTTRDKAGREIQLSEISTSGTVRVYLSIEPGTSREEIVSCTGKATNSWSTCSRGLDFQGGSQIASTTLAYAHNAGSKVILSNVGQFYTEYLSRTGTQTKYDILSFNDFPQTTTSSMLPTANGQFATKLYVDNVGAGGFTASNVSTTLGLQAISSGIPNCTTASACVGVYASSTASANGGYLTFVTTTNSIGRLYWDSLSFLSQSQTWTGRQTMSALVATSTSLGLPFTPTSTTDAANKGYVDTSVSQSVATGTAGMNIYPGDTLYLGATGTLFLTDADISSRTYRFVGISLTQTSATAETRYVKPGGVAFGLSGLIPGSPHYLSGTEGRIATSPGAVPAKIGRALSTSTLQLVDPDFFARASGAIASSFDGGTDTITVGWIPSRINMYCESGAAGTVVNSHGYWALNSDGTSSTASFGQDTGGTANTSIGVPGSICKWNEGANVFNAYVVTTTDGFIVSTTNIAGRAFTWMAEYDMGGRSLE